MENKDIFFFGGGGSVLCAAAGIVAVGPFCGADAPGARRPAMGPESFFLFFDGAFFLATERGLNMSGLPTNFTSSSGF
jgi:hypothetical protein